MAHRIHVFGASGSGTTTLGERLAAALGGRHLDTDAYYWVQTDPPFTTKRDPAERVAFLAWARSYDHALAPVRSLDLHERWMARLRCPVLRLDAGRPVEALCDAVLGGLRA